MFVLTACRCGWEQTVPPVHVYKLYRIGKRKEAEVVGDGRMTLDRIMYSILFYSILFLFPTSREYTRKQFSLHRAKI